MISNTLNKSQLIIQIHKLYNLIKYDYFCSDGFRQTFIRILSTSEQFLGESCEHNSQWCDSAVIWWWIQRHSSQTRTNVPKWGKIIQN